MATVVPTAIRTTLSVPTDMSGDTRGHLNKIATVVNASAAQLGRVARVVLSPGDTSTTFAVQGVSSLSSAFLSPANAGAAAELAAGGCWATCAADAVTIQHSSSQVERMFAVMVA